MDLSYIIIRFRPCIDCWEAIDVPRKIKITKKQIRLWNNKGTFTIYKDKTISKIGDLEYFMISSNSINPNNIIIDNGFNRSKYYAIILRPEYKRKYSYYLKSFVNRYSEATGNKFIRTLYEYSDHTETHKPEEIVYYILRKEWLKNNTINILMNNGLDERRVWYYDDACDFFVPNIYAKRLVKGMRDDFYQEVIQKVFHPDRLERMVKQYPDWDDVMM
jgi:hypothetical protein